MDVSAADNALLVKSTETKMPLGTTICMIVRCEVIGV